MLSDNLLSGKKVVVTRSENKSSFIVSELASLGAEVIPLPLISIAAPLDGGISLNDAVVNFQTYEWVLITSFNGSEGFLTACSKNPQIENWPKIAVIGSSTAEPLIAVGLTIDLMPETAVAESLFEAFPLPGINSKKILLVQAEEARPFLKDSLVKIGWEVEKVVAYRNVIPEIDLDLLAHAKSANLIIFTASSSVKRYYDLQGGTLPEDALCIGPITGAQARNAGWNVLEAKGQSDTDLIEAVKEWAGS